MDELNEQDWEKAKEHLSEYRRLYTDIGASGVLALTLVLNPLVIRLDSGERTRQLYDEIMAVE